MPQVQTLAIIPVSRCFSSHHPCFLTATVQVGDAVSSFQQRPKNVRVSSFKIHLLSRLINFFICFFFFLLSANPLFLKVDVLEGICIFVYGSVFWSGICERTQLCHLLGLFSLGLWKRRESKVFWENVFHKSFQQSNLHWNAYGGSFSYLDSLSNAYFPWLIVMYFWKWSEWLYEMNPNALLFSEKRILYKEAMFLRKLCQWAHFSSNIFETYWRMRMNSGSKFTFPWSVN